MHSRLLVAIIGLLLAAGVCAAAQSDDPRHFDATQFGERVVLGPNWLFAAGDNPAWASPTFDDSGWKTISTEKRLLDNGIRDISYGWYRLHIHLRPGTRNLMVGTEDVSGKYEVFADGVRIGGKGKMTEGLGEGQSGMQTFAVPDNLLREQGDLVLAIRVAVNPTSDLGPGTSTPFFRYSVFLISQDAAERDASFVAAHGAGPALLACGLALGVCLISFALFSALRSNYEYLAIGIFMLAASLAAAIAAILNLVDYAVPFYFGLYTAVAVENFALIEFVRIVLKLRRTRWLLALEIVSSLAFIFQATDMLGIFPPTVYLVTFFLPVLTVKIVLPVLLVRAGRGGNREALLLLPAIFLGCFADYWSFIRNVVFFAHLNALLPYLGFSVSFGSYEVDLWRLGDFAFYLAVLLFLVLRTVRIARERAATAAELEAARAVQHVLIPDEIPSVPGFVLRSVYRPAGQVGGDFFQFLPVKNGGVLVVIGDVSGKGMPAAMTVSLLVGTVRTLAHYTQSPGEILTAMNVRMLARSGGGFTTCLVLRADADGTLTVANAGHIAPYIAGKELPIENGLPLGLAADAAYVESTFRLVADEQLTLLTDGVVEARDKAGVLYGFDRTAALSIQPAESIAQAAQAFGQDDDITALTLARTA
jgi:hypothetical protein